MTRKIKTLLAIATISFSVNSAFAAFPVVEPKATTQKVSQKASNKLSTEVVKVSKVAAAAGTTIANIETSTLISQDEIKSENLEASATSSASASKSQIVALLLAIFLGTLGIHRFYLGYTWQGIVQLLTLGGLGIWTLIDIIRIATGELQPKNDSYTQTL